MKKTKLILFSLALFLITGLFTLPMFFGTKATYADYQYNVNLNRSNDFEIDGNVFTCYRITNDSNSYAVGFKDKTKTGTIEIPSVINEKTIVAVAEGGFRHCRFTEIILPQTVREIQKEAFG